MRICIDARSLLEDEKSGIHQYAGNIIHALARQFPEHQFVLFVNRFQSNGSALESFRHYPNCEIRSTRIPNKLLHTLFIAFSWPEFSRLVGSCDLYFFPNIIFTPGMPHPSVLTVHDLSYLHTPSYYSLKTRVWHRMVKARKMCRAADSLIAVSKATALDTQSCFPSQRGSITIIHSALPPMPKLTQKDGKHYLFLGNIEERKNISGLLDSFAALDKKGEQMLPLILAGKQGFLRQATKKKLDYLQKRKIVSVVGYVSEKEKFELLQSAKALLFPSFYEGFGFPGLEAAYAQIPVIASWTTSLPEILESYALYVNPHDTGTIQEALHYIQSNEVRNDKPPTLINRTWDDVARDTMRVFIDTKTKYENRNRR